MPSCFHSPAISAQMILYMISPCLGRNPINAKREIRKHPDPCLLDELGARTVKGVLQGEHPQSQASLDGSPDPRLLAEPAFSKGSSSLTVSAPTRPRIQTSSHLLDELGARVLEGILQGDGSGDGHAVIDDLGHPVGLLQHHVAACTGKGSGQGSCMGLTKHAEAVKGLLHSQAQEAVFGASKAGAPRRPVPTPHCALHSRRWKVTKGFLLEGFRRPVSASPAGSRNMTERM